MSGLEEALATYVGALKNGADRTTMANDRPTYEQHLAATARMLAALHEDPSLVALREVVASERRAYGWGYLSGDAGAEAERAFDEFAKIVDAV